METATRVRCINIGPRVSFYSKRSWIRATASRELVFRIGQIRAGVARR